jgi:MFS family permease
MSERSPDQRPLDTSITTLWISVFCATAAALVGVTALGKQVYDLTRQEIDLGLLGLAEFAPAAVLVLVTGAVADRFDRRRIVGLSAALATATALGLAAYAHTGPTATGPIFALVVVFGFARAFIGPAQRSLPADVVSFDRLPWLVARLSLGSQAAMVVGPVAGGFLYAVDPAVPYVLMAALLAVSGITIQFVQPLDARTPRRRPATRATARHTLGEALGGLRFIRHQPILLGAISLDLFAVLFGGAVALLPAIAETRLGVGAVGYGWLRAAVGIGAAVVTITLTRRPVVRNVGRTLLVAVLIFGIFTVALGVTTNFVVAFVALAVLSGADAVSVFIRSTLVPLVTPSDRRGRVLAVEMVFIGASNELGAFESGVAGQVLGAPGAVMLGGVATMAIAALWYAVFPALRNVDRFPTMVDTS